VACEAALRLLSYADGMMGVGVLTPVRAAHHHREQRPCMAWEGA